MEINKRIEEARKLKNKAPNLYVQNIEMKYCNYLENKILYQH